MEILIKIAQLLMSLTLLVALHEFGHYIAARIFGIRVEKFYIFFDPWFSLLKWKKGDTEYGVGWLPLGGYCKISGMIDESLDTEQMKLPPKPYEFRSKKAWKRFIVMIAGVTMNLVTAFFIYCGISYAYGDSYYAGRDMVYGYNFSESAKALGFRDGDRIRSIDGEEIDNTQSITSMLVLATEDKHVDIVRDGHALQLTIPYDSLNELRKDEKRYTDMYAPVMPFVVDSIASPTAAAAGLRHGDRVTGIDSLHTDDVLLLQKALATKAGTTPLFTVERDGQTLQLAIPVNNEGKIGVVLNGEPFKVSTRSYSLLQSIPAGARLTAKVTKNYWEQLKLIFQPKTEMYKNLGGFIAIGNFFPGEWDWARFWYMTAFLSIIFAVMNIIPIPGLDGGHALFTLWEMLTGRKPSDKFLEIMQYIGLIFILLLVFYANGNDVYRFLIK